MPTKKWQDAQNAKIDQWIRTPPLTTDEIAERWRTAAKKASQAVETIMEEELQKVLEKLRRSPKDL